MDRDNPDAWRSPRREGDAHVDISIWSGRSTTTPSLRSGARCAWWPPSAPSRLSSRTPGRRRV